VLLRPALADLVERRAERAFALSVAAAADGAAAAAEKHVPRLGAAKAASVAARGVRVVAALANATKLDRTKLLALVKPALSRPEVGVRAQAALVLAAIGGDDAKKEVLALLSGDKDERVRRAALDALVKLAPATDAGARTALVERLSTDASAEVRLAAAAALGVAKNEEARPALEKALVDKDWGVQVCAAVSLGKLGGGSVASLADLAKKHADWKVRGAACEGLMRTASKEALPPLIESLGDADPCVKKGSHVFLCAVAGENLPPDPAPWRAWWAKEGGRFEFRDPRALPSTGGGIEHTKAPAAQIWRGTDVVVLDSRGDHIQTVLEKQKVEHRMTMAGKIGESGVHAGAVFVANCTGEIEAVDVDRVRWFVLVGGNFFGSCWALHETVERALPGVVRKAETASEVIDRVAAYDCSGGSPYVAGVFQEGVVPEYALEGAHLIEVVTPERCEVLLDSPEALEHWGCGNLAVLFRAGHGTVVDSVNHFEAQDFQTVEGLKTPVDRQAWAMDHMGLAYDDWRKTRHEKWWDNSVKASNEVSDLSVFRLVTNVVRLSREGLGLKGK
ncbi:MAG: HEAT repeat domain-containing protein, partial [Planctomycetes bacterium]|nr:HEAT repeat domain-containing protein [Planctomycetota bacterium]